ncbi:hypothetical protein ACIG3E_33280 [Streptomyces sp. NPDC053474]|uniref:hypothetical protein n=1 Tax=Streptomyces sp. NPDC053474 TaxID=3365704 RepID=UPI0037D76C99
MRMYAPEVGSDVFLACFDPWHRVAVVRSGASAAGEPWRLPAVRRRKGEPYARAAQRCAAALAPAGVIRLGHELHEETGCRT